jgi:type I restriction enzyme S subunit
VSAWPSIRLDAVAKVVRGVTYAKGDVVQAPANGDIPILRAGNINGRLILDHDLVWLAKNSVGKDQFLQRNDIVMCMSSGSASIVGKSALLNRDWVGSFGAFCAAVRANEAKADPGYLAHIFQSAGFRKWASAAQGNNIKNLNKSALEGYALPLPPLEEQRRIVGLLDRAAEIRRRADAARAKTRAIMPALFLDMFGDPATNPKGWRALNLGDALLSGPQNGLYRPASDYGEGTRILRIDSFDDGSISDQRSLKRLRIDAASIDKFGLHEGDIVVNRVNSPPQLGKSVLIPELEEATVFESNMMRMRANPEILIPAVVGAMLQLASVRQALIRNAKHAINQSSINQGDVMGIGVFAPPLLLQTTFADQARRLEATARGLDAAAAKAEAMAAGLSAEVFGDSPNRGNGHG